MRGRSNSAWRGISLFTLALVCGGLIGCDEKVETSLTVHLGENGERLPLRLIDPQSGKSSEYYLNPGKHDVRLVLKSDRSEPAELILASGHRAMLNLPTAEEFLHVNEPLRLSSEELGQPIAMIVTRDVELKTDLVGVSIYTPDFKHVLASSTFEHEGWVTAYDEEKMEFLQSYQKVKFGQRGLLFAIDSGMESFFVSGVGKIIDGLLSYGAAIYIAPWVWVRYGSVKWLIADRVDYYGLSKSKWNALIEKYPVVDYFSYVHAGVQYRVSSPLGELPKKKNQLRWVYSGACSSGSSSSFLGQYNAAVGTGHRSTSASPLFQFSIVRNWTYGRSAAQSVASGYRHGRETLDVLGFVTLAALWEDKTGVMYWSDRQDLLESSEPMVSWTEELPPENLFIAKSAVPRRVAPEARKIHELGARTLLETLFVENRDRTGITY